MQIVCDQVKLWLVFLRPLPDLMTLDRVSRVAIDHNEMSLTDRPVARVNAPLSGSCVQTFRGLFDEK
jgi:hypothetical protein